ncbi:MAG: 2-oxoacid:acceptor oxidoreductase subunit alpha [Xanthomonadales bacterium]|nr:2-oxoacid:acceptor oxidoreductase subunit alpha [Gammaproteobacteria bacterium]MBT8052967.1 2-oxoacid:acceptor oxidoreductase subunit alpha [Gammaproteobacteria bacterium]NND57859.1 2-oxoacid:acceptor oxidoreductase subunit alpha [Xanthomonadales bacterium]NNK50739.1 2-oxoacid:acceptor oxidoreductase subunit alpha [Xanthomonadales bacterium]
MPATQNRINDFVLKIGTVNGTGSASANGLLMKALFRMGVPVTGKNLFPSNIQGLPTWYEIRANHRGYMSRSGRADVMVAMNAQTYQKDLNEVSPGGFLIYDSTWPRESSLHRQDITVLGVPLSKLCNENFDVARIRILMKNVAYVGVLAALMDIDLEVIKTLLEETFASKPKLVESNLKAIMIGHDYALENFTCPLPVRAEKMGDNAGHILIDGNSATGLGCVYAGATVGAWYPITPSTGVMDAFKAYCNRFRTDPETGKKNFCIVQAEDELAAAGMVLGGNWAGARSFTPTSGPGISLMSEFIGFAYYAEIPSVFIDVQRVGPSTGMPTRTQQCDLMLCAYASHGDTRHPMLFPANPKECFEMAVQVFDLADRLQTPIFMLSDLDIAMNDWMVPELEWDDDFRPDRGKVLGPEELKEMDRFVRYLDVDGDGITYRTLPGEDAKGAYFVRGSGHNRYGAYTEDSDEYQDVMERLLVKWETAKTLVPPALLSKAKRKTKLGIVAFGSSDGAVIEARDTLAEQGVHADYLRIRSFPFGQEVIDFLHDHETVFVVEQNRDAQMKALLILETNNIADRLVSITHYNGMPIPSECVVQGIARHLNAEVAA